MSWSSLTRVEGPAVPVLDLAAARSHLKLDSHEQDEDIEGFVAAATAEIDGPNGIGIAMISQTWRLSLATFLPVIHLPLGPVISVQSITYVDGAGDVQTLPADAYEVHAGESPGLVFPAPGSFWPSARCQPGSVKIVYVAGYGPSASDVPADLIAAVKLMVGAFDEDREGASVPKRARDILNRYAAGWVV